jgi:hypothetical protein
VDEPFGAKVVGVRESGQAIVCYHDHSHPAPLAVEYHGLLVNLGGTVAVDEMGDVFFQAAFNGIAEVRFHDLQLERGASSWCSRRDEHIGATLAALAFGAHPVRAFEVNEQTHHEGLVHGFDP